MFTFWVNFPSILKLLNFKSIKLFPTNIFILFAIYQNREEAGCYSFYSAEYVHCLSTSDMFHNDVKVQTAFLAQAGFPTSELSRTINVGRDTIFRVKAIFMSAD